MTLISFPLGRAAHAINKLEDQSINSNKKAVDAADAEVRDWVSSTSILYIRTRLNFRQLLIIMHMRNDNNFSQIRRMLQGYDLPEVPEVAQECLKSLSFEEMEDRFHDIERATEGTCKWLLRHEKYRDWTDADRGVLCIKGKPGSGKSTLLHYAVGDAVVASNVPDGLPIQRNEPLPGSREAPADKTESNVLILSFFFHDRGTNLQKTPLGLFRSLLHQVLRCVPDAIPNALLTTFEDRNKKVGEVGKQWHWNWREIRDYFRLSLRNVLESHRVCLFIDALDEYGEEEANELLQSLDFWIQELPSQAQFRICFTCRHYPPLVLPQGTVEIRLEEENEDDISTYVQVQLSSWSKDENLAAIWTEIADRAEGVFVWARLIVPRVLSLERRGENWRKIKREIENTPRALEDLYRSLVQKVETNPDSLKLIRWICFAIEPLTLDELRWAMIVDPDYSDEPASLRHYENLEDFATDCDMMEKKLKALSCGLAEAVPSSRVVQFIHQSVKDFFITEGLWVLQKYQDPAMKKTNEVDLKTTAHSQLSKTCIRYFSAEEFTHSGLDLYSDELTDSFPLLRYAATNWVAHVHQSEKDARQTDLLQYLGWPSDDIAQLWMKLPKGPRESLDVVRQRGLGTILHIASGYQLMGLLRAILQNKELLDNRIDATDSDSPTPLFVAAGEGHYDVVRLLLENGADPNFYCGELGHALGAAAERGDERVIRLLLDYGADANAEARLGQSALQVAALYRHYRAVKILLDNGADADARGGNLGTALQTAPMDPGDEQIALLLVDSGADVNAVGQLPSTPLAKASLAGNEKLVGILIQNGADVNGGKYGSPLKAASMRGHQHIVRMLLENGADVNAPCDKHDGTALEMASSNGDGLLVQILLENGADVNAGENSNPLGAASMRGHQQVVRMLLENGADVNAPCDEDNKTALERALWAGHEQVVQILIEYGAERPSPVL